MADKKKRNTMTTPRGIVSGFTAIQKASTNFEPTGMFETQLAFDPAEVTDMIEELQALIDAEFEKVKADKPKLKKTLTKTDLGTEELDDEGDETGRLIFKFKQKQLIETKSGDTFKKVIQLVDGRGKRVTKPVKIGPGTTAKVNFEPWAYFNAKDKVVGVTLRLIGFQIIKLVEYEGGGGPSAADMGFGAEEDGFDGDDFDGGEDQTDGSGDDEEDDDDIPF